MFTIIRMISDAYTRLVGSDFGLGLTLGILTTLLMVMIVWFYNTTQQEIEVLQEQIRVRDEKIKRIENFTTI